jgi:hypothetical protein
MNKKFRLEMSGWYYSIPEAYSFFGFNVPESELKKLSNQERNKYNFEGKDYSDEVFFKEQ